MRGNFWLVEELLASRAVVCFLQLMDSGAYLSFSWLDIYISVVRDYTGKNTGSTFEILFQTDVEVVFFWLPQTDQC